MRSGKIVTQNSQAFSFTRRALVLGSAQAGVATLLGIRMAWLSIAENERYRTLAESNRVQLTIIPPRRGWIVDRFGKPIAINRTDFRVDLIPSHIHDKDVILSELRHMLALTPEDVDRISEELEKAAEFQPVQVASNLDYDRFAAVSLRAPDMPGVVPASGTARFYPAGAAVAHLVGYVGPASAKDYEETHDPLMITPGFKVGKDSIEKTMESWLRGKPGAKRSEVTARGRLVRELTTRPDIAGNTLKLTIDAGLQEYAARRIGDNSASAVVIDTLTGGILAMTSMPAYDPNSFSDGISHSEWKMLSANDHIPLLNKSLQGLYPPGSTFKPVTALALQRAGIDPEEIVFCNGGYQLGNRRFACLGRHGPMNLYRALARSCNTYFYTQGRKAGIDLISAMAHVLGLGRSYDLPMPSQKYGTVPDPAWKRKRHNRAWGQSDTLNTAIGQGFLQVSPLQLAMMAARIASGRELVPRLIGKRSVPQAPPLPVPLEHLAAVRRGMDEVVNAGGTAVRSKLQLEGIRLAGKTGTAQVRRIAGSARGGTNVPWKYRDHALFIGFAPVDNPRYACSVVVEHGLHGSSAAAPVASDCMLYLFDPQKALAKLVEMEKGWGGDIATRMRADAARWQQAQLEAANPQPAPQGNATTPIAGDGGVAE
jgi:penicillin-binding protein 2